ncbi:LytTR family DNA-binding domain-containing protein [Ferrovibrio sp.]|uniref:LytTR family DNA-binding domain-containing protein n=1 Tax=Ferrovibrio sp. TaxID=1917215 RepID=UPI00311FE9DB
MTQPGTDGGAPVMNGGTDDRAENRRFRFPLWVWALYAAGLVLISSVIGSSYWMEAGRGGAVVPVWPFAVDEVTSIVIVFAVTPLVFAWAARLDPGRVGWLRAVAGHVAGMVAFGAVHIGGMIALRKLVYPLFGRDYGADLMPLAAGLIYEGRKDALSYLGMVIGAWLLDLALQRRAAAAAPVLQPAAMAGAPRRIEIRDGARRVFVDPAEVLWIEAAGNYVELHLPGRSLLQRQTLAAMETALAAEGFLRIHRSRLVNRRHVQAVDSNDSGDFTVTLDDGRQIAGGRRWRAGLQLAG